VRGKESGGGGSSPVSEGKGGIGEKVLFSGKRCPPRHFVCRCGVSVVGEDESGGGGGEVDSRIVREKSVCTAKAVGIKSNKKKKSSKHPTLQKKLKETIFLIKNINKYF